MSFEPFLLRQIPDDDRVEVYIKHGGYAALGKALKEYSPEKLTELVINSGLRGRGGAGFPTGKKWSFIPQNSGKPVYLCVNADESEPGTFKDRELMLKHPHLLIEGTILTAYAIKCNHAFIYIRGEFATETIKLEKAIKEATEKGYVGENILGSGFDLKITVYRGGGAYICGEETALMTSLEGGQGYPRVKPPFPAISGLYGSPTIINNVETLCNLPAIINNGVDWFKSIGTDKSPGSKIFCVSGHVKRPGNYELPMGVSLRELLFEYAGGIKNDRDLKAIIPGGSSVPILTADKIDVKLDFESLAEAGSMLGSAGVIVMDDTTCIVKAAYVISRFYQHESCGQCTPCRQGTLWMDRILYRIEHGKGKPEDLDLLLDICDNIEGNTICPLGDAAVPSVRTSIKLFRDEYEYHIRNKKCLVDLSSRFE